jgi:hypothetical protein
MLFYTSIRDDADGRYLGWVFYNAPTPDAANAHAAHLFAQAKSIEGGGPLVLALEIDTVAVAPGSIGLPADCIGRLLGRADLARVEILDQERMFRMARREKTSDTAKRPN